LSDINAREAWILGLFAAGVLALGVYPKPLVDLMDAPIAALVDHIVQTKL
jgi:NADH-quinone oxidoreductase subunit M